MLEDTIVAISTGNDVGAISIIRMSGDKSFDILEKAFSKDVSDKKSHTITRGEILNDNEVVDDVMVAIYRNPTSYTGEDMVEVFCHGGRLVTNEVLNTLIKYGAKYAEPGEFTLRAYLNGKMDLTQAEAVNDVINAEHINQLHLASKELKGSVRKLLNPLKEEMINTISNIEVNIDYPEYEDVKVLSNDIVKPRIEKWIKELEEIIDRSRSGKIIRDGIKTSIVGKTNAGKSSLFNALLEEDKAIVTDIPGTTRDIVEGEIRLKNVVLKIQDTAGLRKTDDIVENIGLDKTRKSIEDSDLVIIVLDGNQKQDQNDFDLLDQTIDKERIVVFNKSDLTNKKHYGIWISAKDNDIDDLIDEINYRYDGCKEVIKKPALSNERQIGLLQRAYQDLIDADKAICNEVELDLVSVDINDAYKALEEIDGSFTKEDLLDEIFARFCLGK